MVLPRLARNMAATNLVRTCMEDFKNYNFSGVLYCQVKLPDNSSHCYFHTIIRYIRCLIIVDPLEVLTSRITSVSSSKE